MYSLGKTRKIACLLTELLPLFCAGLDCLAASPEATPLSVFSADRDTLAASKSAYESGDAKVKQVVSQLLKEADGRLDQKPPSVMEKNQIPPSGDKHDYISQAPYFWRDTNSPDGKYVRRDGERNPESKQDSDAGRLGGVLSGIHTLGLAYYFTCDEKYAAKAAEIIRVFFLDPATRMNPNLNFGQGIPGEVDGRPTGLIGARGFADFVDGVGLLANSKSLSRDEQNQMKAWARDYFHWLTTSKIGLGEDAASNNHGTFYDVQAISLALYVGDTNYAHKKLLAAQQKRIALEIEPDGKMPRELARTLSFSYSLFNLRAEMNLADLGRVAGVNLWHYQTTDGRSLEKAIEFMAPYANPDNKWPYKQIHKGSLSDLGDVLRRAAVEYPNSKVIADALKYVNGGEENLSQLYTRTRLAANTN